VAERSDFASDREFRAAVEALLDTLLEQADEIDADIEPRLTPGNLSITYEDDDSVMVLSQQTPTHELWLSANYTAWHFLRKSGTWVERDSGEAMLDVLSKLVSDKLGLAVVFSL